MFSGAPDGEVRFHEASELGADHVRALEHVLQRRVLRDFRRHGLLDEADAHDMLTWQGSGGFSVDASVRIDREDRSGIERLVRYWARPPFALERLHAFDGTAALASPEARLLYRLPRPDLEGRTELLLTPVELLERIARFVPPPRLHRHRYHGVLAPNARLRSAVVALGRPVTAEPEPGAIPPGSRSPSPEPDSPPRPASPSRIRWAQLLARIYDVLPLLCPACGSEMRVLAFLPILPSSLPFCCTSNCLTYRPPSRPLGVPRSATSSSIRRPSSTPSRRSPSLSSSSTSPCPTNSTPEFGAHSRHGPLRLSPPVPTCWWPIPVSRTPRRPYGPSPPAPPHRSFTSPPADPPSYLASRRTRTVESPFRMRTSRRV